MWELIFWIVLLILWSILTIVYYKNLENELAKEEYPNIAMHWTWIISCIANIARILVW